MANRICAPLTMLWASFVLGTPTVAGVEEPRLLAPVADLVLEGERTYDLVDVPAGVTVWVTGDLTLRSTGPIRIAGDLAAMPDVGAGRDAPDITLITQHEIVLDGLLRAADGLPGAAPGERGGHGGSLRLNAERIVSRHDIAAGHGGAGGPGARGGDGGEAVVDGPMVHPPNAIQLALVVRGGDGGPGGNGLPGAPGGAGGDGGRAGRFDAGSGGADPADDGTDGIDGEDGDDGFPDGIPGAPGTDGGDETQAVDGADGADDTSPCGAGDNGLPGFSAIGGLGGNGGDGGNALSPDGDGGWGGSGGDGGSATSSGGGDGGDSGNCCFLPDAGADGGDGGPGGSAFAGWGGDGGNGGDGGANLGIGGDGGDGGHGGLTAKSGDGGDGGKGGDGWRAGTGGALGAAGPVAKGLGGQGGTPGGGSIAGSPGIDGFDGLEFSGNAGAEGKPGVDCPPDVSWTDTGCGLGGALGTPLLQGIGVLAPGAPYTVTGSNGAPNPTSAVIVSPFLLLAPFKGGWLIPDVTTIIYLPTPTGSFVVSGTLPVSTPPLVAWLQWWMVDGTAPFGWSASNGLRAKV